MNWTNAIKEHYSQKWNVQPEVCLFQRGPVHELPPEFRVLAFPPHNERSMWTYATCGMSLPDDPKPIELHMFSKVRSESLVELLFVTAHFHRTSARLDLGHTVNFGRPWLTSSPCTFGLVSLPYLDGPDIENFECRDGTGKCYWLIPITKAELELKKVEGVEALETRFDASRFDYAEPMRASVV
jgi:hypothetical protein